MKISTLIWLKSFGGNVGRVYSSKIYAIEFDDTIGYEIEATEISKIHSARYKAGGILDGLTNSISPVGIIKRRLARYGEAAINDAFASSTEAVSITKHRNPAAIIEHGMIVSSAPVRITKKLGGYYIAKTLPADEIMAASIGVSIEKSRKVHSADSSPDAFIGSSVATGINKVRRNITGLKAPTHLRAYYGDVHAPTELTATLIDISYPTDLTATYIGE